MNQIKRILDFSDEVLEYIAMGFIVLMTMIVSVQVFTRYFLSMTPRWSEEVAMLLMVWFGFIGIAIGVKKGIHLSIEYFVDLLPKPYQKVIVKLDELLVGIFGVLLAIYGYKLVSLTGDSTLPATQWPSYMMYIEVPLAGVMIIFYSIAKIFNIEPDKEEDVLLERIENVIHKDMKK